MTNNSLQKELKWSEWAKKLQVLAQNGLTYSDNVFDQGRYQEVQQIAADIFSNYTSLAYTEVLEIFQKETGYATPKVGVRGALFNDNKILLVKERADDKWALPGGWADVYQSPNEAMVKEIWEETGYNAKITKLAAMHDNRKHNSYKLGDNHVYVFMFIGEIIGGFPKINIEISEIDFFKENKLPELSEGRTVESQINLMFKHYRNFELPTEFD